MAAYKLGQVIKMTRENLGITQEELSDGICSVETLSRIENGKQTPNRANFKALMERLGRNGERYLPAVRGVHMHILVKCRELQTLLARLRFQEAETVLNEIEAEINLDDSVNKQLILKVKADIAQGMGRISGKERRKILEQALQCTVRNYKDGMMPKSIFSKMEIMLFCNIAVSYFEEGNRKLGIDMLHQLETYFQVIDIGTDERALQETFVLQNYGQCLGQKGETKKAIEIEERAIHISLAERQGNILDYLLYNLAFEKEVLHYDENICKELLVQAYMVSELNHNYVMMKHIKKHIREKYGDNL